jgi:DNA polymerase III epsilon subunit-like protein
LETTGVIAGHHEITELGFEHEKMGAWSVRVKPKFMDRAQARALAVSRYNPHDWASAQPIEEVWTAICARLEDTIIIGHNVAGFDLPFIHGEARMKGLDSSRISRAWEDTQGLAMTHLVPRGLKRVSLQACCDFLEIPNEGAHHALEDVWRCQQVYYRVTRRQQEMF